jgi:hypothetical protein
MPIAIIFARHWKALVPVALLCLALSWQTYQVARWKGREAKAQATIAQMQLASEKARAAQIALNNENADLSERIATNAALRHSQIATATDRAVSDYVSSHRLRADCYRGTSGANQAAVPSGAETPDSPDGTSSLVAVTASDLESLSKAAVRGREAQAFLIEQVNAGLAVVLPD